MKKMYVGFEVDVTNEWAKEMKGKGLAKLRKGKVLEIVKLRKGKLIDVHI